MKIKLSTLVLALLCLNIGAKAQGVHFEQALSWQEIIKKAKQHNKNIFVDFYATWCGPCKAMDNFVYNQKDVGDAVNDSFISIRVQQDKSSTDNEFVRAWYADAAELCKKFEVSEFPTLLFVSPNGEFLHETKGFQGTQEFLKIVAEAKDPSRQYVLLQSLKDLLAKAKTAKAFDLERAMAKDYINNFLMILPKERLYTKSNLTFLADYVTSKERAAFSVFYPDASKAKTVIGDDMVRAVMNRVITNEIVNPMLYRDGKPISDKPAWQKIEQAVIAKYGSSNLQTTVIDAKIEWYKSRNEWNNMARVTVANFQNHPSIFKNHVAVNSVVWSDFFEKVNDQDLLKVATNWMKDVVEANPRTRQFIDTYANMLYKIGKIAEAIKWQERAVELEKEFATKDGRPINGSYQSTLDKMKAGEKTWPTQ